MSMRGKEWKTEGKREKREIGNGKDVDERETGEKKRHVMQRTLSGKNKNNYKRNLYT